VCTCAYGFGCMCAVLIQRWAHADANRHAIIVHE
jgi:hypothetical protein